MAAAGITFPRYHGDKILEMSLRSGLYPECRKDTCISLFGYGGRPLMYSGPCTRHEGVWGSGGIAPVIVTPWH